MDVILRFILGVIWRAPGTDNGLAREAAEEWKWVMSGPDKRILWKWNVISKERRLNILAPYASLYYDLYVRFHKVYLDNKHYKTVI